MIQPSINWFFPYKEEVTGSNPVAPTRVFQKSLHIYTQKTPKRHRFCRVSFGNIHLVMELDFEFELSKGKQNSLGETLKVVEHIQNNIKEIDKLFLCFFSNNSLVAMRAMNATKRIIKGDNHIFVENKKRFIDEFSESEHNVVKLGLITIYYDFISYFDDKEYKVISKNAMNWVENSKDWMILAQGLKLLEKLSNSDEILKSNVISIARQLKNDERKAVRSQAQKILKDT